MEVTFQVTMTPRVMYDFLMNHTYKSPAGLLGVVFGAAAFVVLGLTWGSAESWQSMLYGLFGLWFLLYQPVSLYLRAAAQVKTNPVYKNPIAYRMTQEGISTSQGDQIAKMGWMDMEKARETKKSLLLYTGKRSCVVLPKESMGEQYGQAVKLIREHMEPRKIKLKTKE